MTSQATITLGRVRGGVVAAMVGLTGVAWAYTVLIATQMDNMSSVLAMPMTSAWTPVQTTMMITMWTVMMAAMMLPSAAPMVLMYDRMDRTPTGERGGSTALFVTGYVLVWMAFAVVATALQWVLHDAALVDGMGELTQSTVAGALLIGSGVFQFSPIKRRSLQACRTPMGFLMTSWREGPTGALSMGLHHGSLCLRCCWALMVLLFVLGIMNLIWVVALSIFVLAEKLAPRGETIARVGGVVMVVWGVVVILGVGG